MININGVNATLGRDEILIEICFLHSSKIQNCFQMFIKALVSVEISLYIMIHVFSTRILWKPQSHYFKNWYLVMPQYFKVLNLYFSMWKMKHLNWTVSGHFTLQFSGTMVSFLSFSILSVWKAHSSFWAALLPSTYNMLLMCV